MNTVIIIVFLSVSILYSRGDCALECDDSDEVLADVCYKLYEQIESALVADKGNIYRLRNAFFYAPNANPVLLKVIYNVSYSDNVTENTTYNYCTQDTTENKKIMLNKTRIILGWTSSGVFTLFHPLTINFMQIQLPFAIMRIMFSIFRISHPNDSGPEAETLLWDGSYDLPTLYLNIHLTSLPCIPTEELFQSIINDINSLLRIYAGQDFTGIIQDSGNTHFVGFSLPKDKVLSNNVRGASDYWFYVVYVMSTIILYATCVTTIFFVVSKSDERGIKSFTTKHPEVLRGMTIVISAFTILEVITELVMAIVWTVYVHDPLVGFTVFLAALVYYSPGIFSLLQIGHEVYQYYHGQYDTFHDVLFQCFVWTTSYFVYILLYSFFPAFVLAFAYPTRVITIFVFTATFMILSVVYLTTYMSKGISWKWCERNQSRQVLFRAIVWCITSLFLIYYFLFVFALLYSLVIGKASVVSSAPLAILSLLPSIIISIVAWLLKSTMLENNINEVVQSINGTCSERENSQDTAQLEETANQNAGDKIELHLLQQPDDESTSQKETSTPV